MGFNITLTQRISTIHVVNARLKQSSTSTGNTFTNTLYACRWKKSTINVFLINVTTPIYRRIRGPTIRRFNPMQIITKCYPNRYRSAIFPIPIQGIMRVVFRQVRCQSTIKMSVSTSIPVPRKGTFTLYIRNGTIRHTLISKKRTRARQITFAMFRLARLNIMTRIMTTFRRLIHLCNGSLLFTRTTLNVRTFILLMGTSCGLPSSDLFLT